MRSRYHNAGVGATAVYKIGHCRCGNISNQNCIRAYRAKTGGKRVLMAGLLTLAASGALYLTGTRSLGALIAIRILQGFGTGMVSATVQGLVAVWFTAGERGTAQGALAAFYGASTSIVTIYASFMSARGMLWYETAGYMLLVCGLLFAVMIGVGYKDIEKTYGVNVIDEAIAKIDVQLVKFLDKVQTHQATPLRDVTTSQN